MKLRHKKGFTIIELVIVIAVIGILTAVLVPTFINLTNKANEAADDSLVKNLNTALKMEEQLVGNKKNETLQDAIDDLKDEGYLLENLVSKSGKDLLWNQPKNEFVLNKENEYSGKDYWQIVKEVPAYANQKYSYYAGSQFNTSVPDIKYGFDSGDNDNIAVLNYVGNGAPGQSVAIRTNGASTTLTINASNDTVAHYGEAGALNIIAVKTSSYHENGKVSFAEINTGRIVLEPSSEITAIHINKKANAEEFDEVIIADNGTSKLPSAITRDEVTVAAESSVNVLTVVSLNGTQEVVKVYGSNVKGSTEKTSTQNTDVNSALGELALDNGGDSKALDSNEKEDVKEDVAGSAVAAELVDDEHENKAAYIRTSSGVKNYYDTLDLAFAALQDGDTLLLLKDVNVQTEHSAKGWFIKYSTGKQFTFNGCDHKVTANNSGTGRAMLFEIHAAGSVKNLTIESTGFEYILLYEEFAGDCLVKNVNITGDNTCFSAAGANQAGVFPNAVVEDCTFNFVRGYESRSDYNPQAHNAIAAQYGSVITLNNCNITSNGGAYLCWPSGGTIIANNNTVKSDIYFTYAWICNGSSATRSDSIIRLNGCKLTGEAEHYAVKSKDNDGCGHKAEVYVDEDLVAYCYPHAA